MKLFENLVAKKVVEEERAAEYLTFRETEWNKVRSIILVDGRHVDLVKDTEDVDGKKVVTYTVLMYLTREEAIELYASMKANGIKKFVNNNEKKEDNKK